MIFAPCRRARGFTLIELLIVIAIIAILALIAIPNFLESQVRARVSRVHADMRSIGTALEAYLVDNNEYPLFSDDFTKLIEAGVFPDIDHGNVFCLRKLTTPISYMTSIPRDPFTDKGIIKKEGSDPAEGVRNTYEYKAIHANAPYYGIIDQGLGKNNARVLAWNKGYRWTLDSLGPDRNVTRQDDPSLGENPFSILAGTEPLDIYDPTNGTMSSGMIIRTNKGVYAGQDYLER